ncbi:MAG: Type-2 restriction enzyme MboI [Spirochaetes bacterium ADurb.Bin133]|nr:MAG: Type-2 restriction enzyme MboI [Spirochaetes bacterium ADurb.Bin133]
MSFEKFLSQLSATNLTLDTFIDFSKVVDNINRISIKLNQLNYLIGKEELKKAISDLFKENKNCFSVLNLIIAVRDNRPVINNSGNIVSLDSYFKSPEKVYEFILETGLSDIFKNKNITNLVDYVFGIEVGLDTNARKNRGGKRMEKVVENVFSSNKIPYKKEVYITDFKDLTALGDDIKRFDFVIETDKKTYLIEANFYNGGGSKLNEVARSYSDLAPKINSNPKFEFVWITDGQGWLSAKNKLQEAINNIPKVYNLRSLPEFINILRTEL